MSHSLPVNVTEEKYKGLLEDYWRKHRGRLPQKSKKKG